jgi:Sec-independent protein translocase protein TatA
VALLLFGPEQLPQIARQLGKITAELRKSSQAIRREWYNAVYPPAQEVRNDLAAHTQDLRALRAEVLAPPDGSVGAPSRKTPAAQPSASAPSHVSPAQPSQETDT